MATQAQITANQRNAQKSTGPKTASGLQKAAKNSLKHGFTARQALISGEDAAAFDRHRTQLLDELDPVGSMESLLADRIVTLSWRLSRTARIQTGTYNALKEKNDRPSPLDNLLSSVSSGNVTPDLIRGPDQPQDSGLQTDLTLGRIAIKDFSDARVLDRLLMYERRIEHSLYRSVLQYQHLQYNRKQAETNEIRAQEAH